MNGVVKRLIQALVWAAAILLILGAFAYAFTEYPVKGSADVAAWVQAVGSIAAIAGSIWAVRFQLKRQADIEAERQRKMEQQRLIGFLSLLHHSTRVVHKIVNSIEQKKAVDASTAVFMRIDVAGIRARFAALDPRDFTHEPRLIDAYSVAVASAQILEAEFDAYSRALEFGFASVPSLHAVCVAARNYIWTETKDVRRALIKSGFEVEGDERLEPSL